MHRPGDPLGFNRDWRRCVYGIAGYFSPTAAVPPPIEARGTGWIRVPPRSGAAVTPRAYAAPGSAGLDLSQAPELSTIYWRCS